MSGAGPQRGLEAANGTRSNHRSPLAHLLHALNQPLTGLQCSLELAVAGPRPAEQYIRTLREGLELAHRMRILVEAIRELADAPAPGSDQAEPLLLDELVSDTLDDLLPVAETRHVHFAFVRNALPVHVGRRCMTALLFRFLDSVLSLAQEGTELQITATTEPAHARLVVSWNQSALPEHSPFSRQELGLLIAQTGWEQSGAEWNHTQTESTHTCTIRLPLTRHLPHCDNADLED